MLSVFCCLRCLLSGIPLSGEAETSEIRLCPPTGEARGMANREPNVSLEGLLYSWEGAAYGCGACGFEERKSKGSTG